MISTFSAAETPVALLGFDVEIPAAFAAFALAIPKCFFFNLNIFCLKINPLSEISIG